MTQALKIQVQVLGSMVALMWASALLNLFLFRGSLVEFGIIPRAVVGLRGILFAPFLHAGLGHLMANTVPFIILGWLVLIRSTEDFFTVTAIAMGVGGLGTWLFAGPRTVHVGASGLIFGYLGYLLLRGYFERSFAASFLSILVAVLYGSLIFGVLPSVPGISWQGHLFGFLGGGVAARFLAKP
ncbi:MAG: rhomboid family intramembrane serine protease [Cyanobacteria bacterium P01_A01_bin.17]